MADFERRTTTLSTRKMPARTLTEEEKGPLGLNFAELTKDRRTFAILNTYHKSLESKNVEYLLKTAQVQEEVKIYGPITIISMVETTKDILCCKFTEEYDYMAIGFTDGMVRLFKTNSGDLAETLQDAETERNPSPVTGVKHRPISKNYPISGCLTCTYANGCVKCWNHTFNQCMFTIREKRQTFGLAYHPRLPKFVTYGDDCKIYLYDEETRTQERILSSSETPGSMDGHTSRIFTCCFNPRSNHEFVSGGWDNVVHFWDLRQPHALRHLSGIHMCGDGIDISQKGTEVLTCSWQKENALSLWDYGSGELIVNMEPDIHDSMLYAGKFLTKEIITAAGCDPNIIRFVDLKGYTTVASISGLPGGVYSLDMGPVKKVKKGDNPQAILSVPKVIFCSGKRIYQIDFS